MERIGFTHNYSKLHEQTYAQVLMVRLVYKDSLNSEFIQYDTDGLFQLEDDDIFIELILLGNKGIPFTTLRSYTQKNADKYLRSKGTFFEIYVNENPKESDE